MLDFWYIVTFFYRPNFGPIRIDMSEFIDWSKINIAMKRAAIAIRVLASSVISAAEFANNLNAQIKAETIIINRWKLLTRSPHPILAMSLYYRAKQIRS